MEQEFPHSNKTMSKTKIKSTTQDFTQIVDIKDDVVFFKDRSACMVLETSSVNFFLLSQDEQNARIYGYMALLNSLSFPIQIVIISRRVDMSSYLSTLEQRIANVKNPKIAQNLSMYKDFIEDLVKGEGLLDKKLYVIIPFTNLELGPVPARGAIAFNAQAKSVLLSKRDNVLTQIERMGLMSKTLGTEELAKLFYEIFNQEFVTLDFESGDVKNIIL